MRGTIVLAILLLAGCRGGRSFLRVTVEGHEPMQLERLVVTVTHDGTRSLPVDVPLTRPAMPEPVRVVFSLEFDGSRSGPATVDVTAHRLGGAPVSASGAGEIRPGDVTEVLVQLGQRPDGGVGLDGGFACDDGAKNGDETDVDCGGSCAPCGLERVCIAHRDCTSAVCATGRCAGWAPIGPWGGAIMSLAVDPAEPARAWAGTMGGLFRTVDGGRRWERLEVPAIEGHDVNAIALDPTRRGRILVGAGRELYASTDDGRSWSAIEFVMPGMGGEIPPIYALAVAPTAPPTLYLGTASGLFATRDDGKSWKSAGMETVTCIAVSPVDPMVAWIGTDHRGVFRTDANLGVWIDTTVNNPMAPADVTLRALAETAGPPRRLYAATDGNGLFQFDISAQTWAEVAGFAPRNVQGVVIDPSDPTRLYAVGAEEGVFRSGPGGWQMLTLGLEEAPLLTTIAVAPSGGPLWLATSRGVHRSDNEGGRWELVGAGMNGFRVTRVLLDPQAPDTLWAVARGLWGPMLFFRSDDGGATWRLLRRAPEVFDALESFPGGAGGMTTTLIAGTVDEQYRGAISQSSDRGDNWSVPVTVAPARQDGIGAIAVDPSDAKRWLAGLQSGSGGGGIHESRNGGMTWAPLNNGLRTVNGQWDDVNAIAFDEHYGAWAGFGGSGVYRLLVGATSWTSAPGTIAMPEPMIYMVAVNRGAGDVYVGAERGFFVAPTDTAPVNWRATEHVGSGNDVVSIAFHRTDDKALWVGTFGGISYTGTGGMTLRPWTSQKTLPAVWSIESHPTRAGLLYAASDGRGVYKTVTGGQ